MISISCPGFCMTPFPEMFEAISQHFDSWEIIAEGLHFMEEIEGEIQNIRDSYDMKFTVHAPFSDLNLASLNPKIREETIMQVVESIRISSELGITVVSLHPGHRSPLGAYFPKKISETNKKTLRELERASLEYDVVLALENMPKMWISLCHDAEQMRELIEGTELKVCFDVGHANISGSIEGFLDLKNEFANVHLHDNPGDVDRHMVLGEGNIDIKGILKSISAYKGDYVIESMNLQEGIKSKEILKRMLGEI